MSALDPSPQRVRLFQTDLLEKLTLISPQAFAVTWSLVLPIAVWAGWGAVGPLAGLGLLAVGLVIWSLFEYAMHRYLFHLELDLPVAKWFVFLIHGNHHDHPNDSLRGLMPFSVSVPVLTMVVAGCTALLGLAGIWLFLGFFVGYLIYDITHYACHHLPMRGRLASALKRHHMRHHFIDDESNFAISAIFWDRVFGTRIDTLKP
ncbi:sterol desaturase family protein [Novosphingobium sp. AP12]|jgi:sterol desaturase/sphingolipid hydroxylase (fatty acid hydroxylase superfamily)|uniref:sterol desaturase family protein n=1 Tax=Novosphingobium sp. AP12 TaxID=1144305 RepID=UPI000272056B|nr:sterol desaturase family protein [Novosphingobium sp. AP12]EJL30702.1 sterol desaturase [Novosphingobium sp. AP12]